jgi:hypothetical protein
VIANSNGEKIEVAVGALHHEITMLCHIAERLTQSVATLAEACSEIEQAGEVTRFSVADMSESDREQVETSCAAAYTSELERRILRAALFGESIPAEGAAGTSNDVELF